MKRSTIYFVTFVTILIFAGSCYYDNEEFLYPGSSASCDTNSVTFSGKIAPLLADNCLSCHSNAAAPSAGNNIRLENYSDVMAMSATISGAINRTGSFSPMPKNGPKLSICLINQFDIWVRNGTLNN